VLSDGKTGFPVQTNQPTATLSSNKTRFITIFHLREKPGFSREINNHHPECWKNRVSESYIPKQIAIVRVKMAKIRL
jgi:hypothetical protein